MHTYQPQSQGLHATNRTFEFFLCASHEGRDSLLAFHSSSTSLITVLGSVIQVHITPAMADDSYVIVGTPLPQIKTTDAFGDPKRINPTRDQEARATFTQQCMQRGNSAK